MMFIASLVIQSHFCKNATSRLPSESILAKSLQSFHFLTVVSGFICWSCIYKAVFTAQELGLFLQYSIFIFKEIIIVPFPGVWSSSFELP